MKKSLILLASFAMVHGQETTAEKTSVNADLGAPGGRLTIEATGVLPKSPLFYKTEIATRSLVTPSKLSQSADLVFSIIQGKAESLSLELIGEGEVKSLTGENVVSWAVREEKEGEITRRYLDIVPTADGNFEKIEAQLQLEVENKSGLIKMPTFGPLNAAGFSASYQITPAQGSDFRLQKVEGATSLKDGSLQAHGRAEIFLETYLSATEARPVEWSKTRLEGEIDAEKGTGKFIWHGVATVSAAKSQPSLFPALDGDFFELETPIEIDFLSGKAAPLQTVSGDGYRLVLEKGRYRFHFSKAGVYPLEINFIAKIDKEKEWQELAFSVPGGAVVPVALKGLSRNALFAPENAVSLVAENENSAEKRGFLPADGQMVLRWNPEGKAEEGKLFFTSSTQSEVSVGAGLLRQETRLEVKTLQGELGSLEVALAGAGEILAVEGASVWSVESENDQRVLKIKFENSIKKEGVFFVKSQTALTALPTKIEPLRLTPIGAVRHSGFLRLTNQGAVKLEVTKTEGLTQLSPEQSPQIRPTQDGERQVFYYRFPLEKRAYEIAVDRIMPEIAVSQILVYGLTETDRILKADVELDIREAAIREYELRIPADYPVVSVTGAEVSDYVLSEPENGMRRLKILFVNEVAGRRLISFNLEKNEGAASGNWNLPVPQYSDAKSLRGQIGIGAVPGFRLNAGKIDGLAEIPLAHFQKKAGHLQQTYRLRGESWQANFVIEALAQNVQADLFHLYVLKEKVAYVSVLINYFITGAPVDEWKLALPEGARNVQVEGAEVRDSRQENGILVVPLHRSVMGAYQLLVTYEQDAAKELSFGNLQSLGVQGERGFVQVVSPGQIAMKELKSAQAVKLDPLELPAEYRLMSHAPSLAAWQYTGRPFELKSQLAWHEPATMAKQVVEFCQLNSQVSRDGSVATQAIFEVRSQGEQMLRLKIPAELQVWEVKVGGKQVTTRQSEGERLVPLPGTRDENLPVRVEVRAGQEAQGKSVDLHAPTVSGRTQLTTHWSVKADEGRALSQEDGVLMSALTATGGANGFDWIANHALFKFFVATLLILAGLAALKTARFGFNLAGFVCLIFALGLLLQMARFGFSNEANLSQEIDFVLPVLAPDVPLKVSVTQDELAALSFSGFGFFLIVLGLGALIWSAFRKKFAPLAALVGLPILSLGLLLQVSGAGWFALLVIFLVVWLAWPRSRAQFKKWLSSKKTQIAKKSSSTAAVTLLAVGIFLAFSSERAFAEKLPIQPLPERAAADQLTERWKIDEDENHLQANGKLQFTAKKPGEEFLLLRAPAVLQSVAGAGVKVEKRPEAGGWSYVLIPAEAGAHEIVFSYELKLTPAFLANGIALKTGAAGVREVRVVSAAKNREFSSPAALSVEEVASGSSEARLRFGPVVNAPIFVREKKVEVSDAERRYYAEMHNLFVPGPGVVNGHHELRLRPSQGKVKELELSVPKNFTIGEVRGETVSTWRFDPEKLRLKITLTEASENPFALLIESQGALGELPADLSLSPLRVLSAAGEVGTFALAFGSDAQLDKATAKGMSEVALTDFPAKLLPRDGEGNPQAILREVYRYGKEEASLSLRVVEVMPELRVTTNEVLSLGEERVVLRTELQVNITRAGIFKLSFELPIGYEVESLSGTALSHWAELKEDEKTIIVMHLNGKTMGSQQFALSLVGPMPKMGDKKLAETKTEPGERSSPPRWDVPRVIIREAARQNGQLVVAAGQGIQLKEAERKDVSALDPRELGGQEAGSLAYRLLQKTWRLSLHLSSQEAWVTAKFLQDVELREEQVRSRVDLQATIERASLESLRLRLPDLSENDRQTVRASGAEVRDIQPVAGKADLWEVFFKRRVAGSVAIRVEYEESGRAQAEKVSLKALEIPAARQVEGFLALRPGLRLELGFSGANGWQESGWLVMPKELRQADRAESPALLLRSKGAAGPVNLTLKRHEVAESLRLRVRAAELYSILSTGGEMMNEAVLTLQVMQAGSLSVRLPAESELLGVFVNEESTRVVRDGDVSVFQISGDAGRDEARVRFYYVTKMPLSELKKVSLQAFQLGLPLENFSWQVNVPLGYELADAEGDLDLLENKETGLLDLANYREEVRRQNAQRESETRARFELVSDFLREGDQQKAMRTLSQVTNSFALNAASNEDARVQLEALQRRQAVIGFNTRKQRLFYDNQVELPNSGADQQILEAASENPVFRGEVNFKQGDYGRLLQGNTQEENRMLSTIASRWVAHQKSSEPIPRLLKLVLADSGQNYFFHRGIQVNGDAALGLELRIEKENSANSVGKSGAILLALLLALSLAGALVFRAKRF